MTTVGELSPESITAIEELLQPVHNLTATISEDEINTVLDEALSEVRRERKTQSSA